MTAQLTATVDDLGGISHVKLAGVIDERNDLGSITDRISNPIAIINTSEVARINSCGVGDWIAWFGEMERRKVDAYLAECATVIMTQVNIISNFVGHAQIVSFFAPYYCPPPCEEERVLLLDVKQLLQAGPPQAPSCTCDKCGSLMEFDESESVYFAWLRDREAPKLPAAVTEAMSTLSTQDSPLRKRKLTTTTAAPSPQSTASSTKPPSPSVEPPVQTAVPAPTTATDRRYHQQQKLLYVVLGLLFAALALLLYSVVAR